MREKLMRCERCGKLVVGKKLCDNCSDMQRMNDDPFVVTPVRLMKFIIEYKNNPTAGALRELDYMLSQAYYFGYISEDFYEEKAIDIGLKLRWDKPLGEFSKDWYDYSDESKIGFYYDQFEVEE